MRDWIKCLITFFIGVAVALAIALPLTLPTDEEPTITPPSSDQRFPDHKFVSYDDMWSGNLSYKSFNYQFSKVTPEMFICQLHSGEIMKFPFDSYIDGGGNILYYYIILYIIILFRMC